MDKQEREFQIYQQIIKGKTIEWHDGLNYCKLATAIDKSTGDILGGYYIMQSERGRYINDIEVQELEEYAKRIVKYSKREIYIYG